MKIFNNLCVVVSFSFIVIFSIYITGCEKNNFISTSSVTGCLVGYGNDGIGIISLKSSQGKLLLSKDKYSKVDSPIYDNNNQILYYIDNQINGIMKFDLSEKKPKKIYEIPSEYKVYWLLPDLFYKNIFFLLYAPGSLPDTLVKLNIDSSEIKEISSSNYYPSQKPVFLDESNLIMQILAKDSSGKRIFTLSTLNVNNGNKKLLLKDADDYTITPDRNKLLVFNSFGEYCLYKLPNMKLLKKIPSNILPDLNKYNAQFLFIKKNQILFSKHLDRKFSLGLFVLDLDSYKVSKLTDRVIKDITYISDCSL